MLGREDARVDATSRYFNEYRNTSNQGLSKRRRISMDPLSEHRPIRSRGRSSGAAQRGSSLIGLLIVVLILGVMAAVTLGTLGYTPNSAMTGIPSTMPGGGAIVATSSTTIGTHSLGNHAGATAMAACRADYARVSAAVQNYKKLNGALPPAGTAWAHAATKGGPLLKAWPRVVHRYTIMWNGSTLSVVPVKGTVAHGSVGTSSPPTGCYAA